MFALVDRSRRGPELTGLSGVGRVDMHGEPEAIRAAADELLEGRRPAAVVALAERTVLAAARLRDDYGLGGNSVRTAMRCADKLHMKRAMHDAGVPVAPWASIETNTSSDELIEELGLPLVLKPRRDSGGRGQQRVDDPETLARALEGLPRHAMGWLAEGWIDGVEMSVESFVREGKPCFVNPTEYLVVRHANVLPAALAPAVRDEVLALNERALRAVEIVRGITHLELFLTERGPVFGELAARPPGGRLMPLLARAWGFDPWEALFALELGESYAFPATHGCVAGVWVLHPGAGQLEALRGLDEARKLAGIRSIEVTVAAGEQILPREGSGQDVGRIFADGATRDEVAASLRAARETLNFDFVTEE